MKTVSRLCKEGISISIATMLTFLDLMNTPHVHIQELHCLENATQTSDIIANEMQGATAQTMTKVVNKELQDSPCTDILVDIKAQTST